MASDGWHRGVFGIVAARLVDALGVPAAVIALDGAQGHGSVRTKAEVDVHEALGRCAAQLGAWGGHRAAAGFSIDEGALHSFRASFSDATKVTSAGGLPAIDVDVALGGAFRVPSVEDLRGLGPFGEGFREPLFLLDAHVVEATGVGADRQHAKLKLRVGQDSLRAFAPGMFGRVEGRKELRLVGEIQPDHWLGGKAVELLVKDVLD